MPSSSDSRRESAPSPRSCARRATRRRRSPRTATSCPRGSSRDSTPSATASAPSTGSSGRSARRAPGLVAAGRRVPTLVGLIDLVPTILDLLALPAPPIVQGRSLAPELRGGTDSGPARVLFAENSLHGSALVARSAEWKAFFDGDGPMRIHSLSDDPDERDPGSGRAFSAA